MKSPILTIISGVLLIFMAFSMCKTSETNHPDTLEVLKAKGLKPELIYTQAFLEGIAPRFS